jgi:mannose-6-phosphate isomerase-like protein (cupin superfamily)
MTRLIGRVDKGWGHEDIFVTNDHYCGKFLHFKAGKRFSMHFHKQKHETWYVLKGRFILEWINTENAETVFEALGEGDVWVNEPLKPHRLTCVEEGTIIEVSTPDSVEDNYRIIPGDSQK